MVALALFVWGRSGTTGNITTIALSLGLAFRLLFWPGCVAVLKATLLNLTDGAMASSRGPLRPHPIGIRRPVYLYFRW